MASPSKKIERAPIPFLHFGQGSDTRLNACVGWALNSSYGSTEMDIVVQGYRRAAKILFDDVDGNNGRDIDSLFFPLCYMWRHYLELALKDILLTNCRLEDERAVVKPTHDLLVLWNEVRPIAQKLGAPSDELAFVGDFIHEFHAIDPEKTGFRYPFTRNHTRSLSTSPDLVNLGDVREVMERAERFLDATRLELQQRADYAMEARADARCSDDYERLGASARVSRLCRDGGKPLSRNFAALAVLCGILRGMVTNGVRERRRSSDAPLSSKKRRGRWTMLRSQHGDDLRQTVLIRPDI